MTKKKTPNRKSKSKARATKWAAKMAKNDHFVDRDLSLLEFNKRVLEQACDVSVPLLERLKFLGILHSNLDELFMRRMWFSRLL